MAQGIRRDWSGTKQGSLTIQKDVGKDAHGSRLWQCVCDCGAQVIKSSNVLNDGAKYCSRPCPQRKGTRSVHGMSRTTEYITWAQAKERCNNPKNTAYHRYGGRGVQMHLEWEASFETFYAYIGPRPSPKHSLDRIDNDGHYEPGNVRWATKREQSNNRHNSIMLEHDGEVRSLMDWARHYGLTKPQIVGRYHIKGLRPPELFAQDVPIGRPPSRTITHAGQTLSLPQWAERTGIKLSTIVWRYKQGWPPERILHTV